MGKALHLGQLLPVPAICSSAVSMRLKAQVARQRVTREFMNGQPRLAINGRYAAQVGSQAQPALLLLHRHVTARQLDGQGSLDAIHGLIDQHCIDLPLTCAPHGIGRLVSMFSDRACRRQELCICCRQISLETGLAKPSLLHTIKR